MRVASVRVATRNTLPVTVTTRPVSWRGCEWACPTAAGIRECPPDGRENRPDHLGILNGRGPRDLMQEIDGEARRLRVADDAVGKPSVVTTVGDHDI